MATLEVWRDGELLETHALAFGRAYSVGRAADAMIPADHASCSRQHAVIRVDPHGRATIEDLDSAHGTRVDGAPLQPRAPLSLRDCATVNFGESSRRFLFKAAPGAPQQAVGRLSTDEKRKLLWAGKRRAADGGGSSAARWDGEAAARALGGDEERQDKFLALTGAKRAREAAAERVEHQRAEEGGEAAAGAEAEAAAAAAQQQQRQQHALFSTLERQFQRARGGPRPL